MGGTAQAEKRSEKIAVMRGWCCIMGSQLNRREHVDVKYHFWGFGDFRIT